MTALLDGIHDGDMTTDELLGKGNFGLGTFDAVDGEMVIIDGIRYQLKLPLTKDFSRADRDPENLDEKIHTTEVKD